ncbi:MAG: HAD family hydrolase [Fidelibacterota bacterium]
MLKKKNIKVIGFDADDTLWVNESYYNEVEENLGKLLKDFLTPGETSRILFETEIRNLPIYGYGIKAFILSVIETSLKITHNKIPHEKIVEIIEMGKAMLNKPIELLDGIEEVLQELYNRNFRLIVATKGDLLDQERKLEKSGLEKYFHHIEIMSDKQESNYKKLINHLDIKPQEFLMVGNSVKSDILPVLNLGGNAIHIPYHTTWAHEEVKDTGAYNFETVESVRQVPELLDA